MLPARSRGMGRSLPKMQWVLQTYSATPTSPNLMRPIIEKPGGPLLYHEADTWAKMSASVSGIS